MVGKEYIAPSVKVQSTPSRVLKKSVTMCAFLLQRSPMLPAQIENFRTFMSNFWVSIGEKQENTGSIATAPINSQHQ